MQPLDFKIMEDEIQKQLIKLEDPFIKGCKKVSEVSVKIDAFKDRITEYYCEAIKYLNNCEQDVADKEFLYKRINRNSRSK